MSNTDIFQHLVTTNMNDSEKGHLMQFHKRVKFKLDAARYFLDRLEELDQKAGSLVNTGIERFDVELNLDAFLYEVNGAIDPLLQEINIAFKLPLEPRKVLMNAVIAKLPNGSQTRKTLYKLHRDTQGWFWRLREYRNHSAHRKIIGFFITVSVGSRTGERAVYLFKNPLNPEEGRGDTEVIQYCQDSLKNMQQLIEEIYGLCTTEISTG